MTFLRWTIWATWRKFDAVYGPDWRSATQWTRTMADLLDVRAPHPKKSLEAIASSQVLINSPASRPAENACPRRGCLYRTRGSRIPRPSARPNVRMLPARPLTRFHPIFLSNCTEAVTPGPSNILCSVRINSQPWRSTSCLDHVHASPKRCSCDETIAAGLHWATIHLPQVWFMPSALWAWSRNSAFPEAAEP